MLEEHEAKIWREQTAGLHDIPADFEPIHVQVGSVIKQPIELVSAINDAFKAGRLTEEQNQKARQFVWDLLDQAGNAEAILADLPYDNGDTGLEVKLTFPHHGGDYGH